MVLQVPRRLRRLHVRHRHVVLQVPRRLCRHHVLHRHVAYATLSASAARLPCTARGRSATRQTGAQRTSPPRCTSSQRTSRAATATEPATRPAPAPRRQSATLAAKRDTKARTAPRRRLQRARAARAAGDAIRGPPVLAHLARATRSHMHKFQVLRRQRHHKYQVFLVLFQVRRQRHSKFQVYRRQRLRHA